MHLLLRKPFKKKFLTNVQTIFYRLKERGDSIIILSLLCFRTRSATTCRCTASSWGCRTRERASPAGGWSTRTHPRLGSHPGEELQTLTMVSQLIINLWMKSHPLFRQTPSYCAPPPPLMSAPGWYWVSIAHFPEYACEPSGPVPHIASLCVSTLFWWVRDFCFNSSSNVICRKRLGQPTKRKVEKRKHGCFRRRPGIHAFTQRDRGGIPRLPAAPRLPLPPRHEAEARLQRNRVCARRPDISAATRILSRGRLAAPRSPGPGVSRQHGGLWRPSRLQTPRVLRGQRGHDGEDRDGPEDVSAPGDAAPPQT